MAFVFTIFFRRWNVTWRKKCFNSPSCNIRQCLYYEYASQRILIFKLTSYTATEQIWSPVFWLNEWADLLGLIESFRPAILIFLGQKPTVYWKYNQRAHCSVSRQMAICYVHVCCCIVFTRWAVSMEAPPTHCDVHNKHAQRIAIGCKFKAAHAQQTWQRRS